jgi:serine/threonine protein phosphatase PrpC
MGSSKANAIPVPHTVRSRRGVVVQPMPAKMQDAQILYTVTGVVVAGLGTWVARVLAKAPVFVREALPAPVEGPPPVSARELAEEKIASLPKITPVEDDDEPTGPYAMILVTAVGTTDQGKERKNNEDSYSIDDEHHLLVVADGMGRHAAGEVASSLAVSAICEAFTGESVPARPPEPDAKLGRRGNRLRAAVCVANERVYARSLEVDEYGGMGTTVVSAHFSPNKQKVYLAHVGDSRCYRLRGGKLARLTQDHTLGAAGITGKNANVLVRALGPEPEVEVDVAVESPLPGDVYLLCSDGLTRMVPEAQIEATLAATPDLKAATAKLVELANGAGGRDNITLILASITAAPLPP